MATDKMRAYDAAKAYAERVGFQLVDDLEPPRTFTALDGAELVLLTVRTRRTDAPNKERPVTKKDAATAREIGAARIDKVEMTLLAPDRAILRHHREAMRTQGAPCPLCGDGRISAELCEALGFEAHTENDPDGGTTLCPYCEGHGELFDPYDIAAAAEAARRAGR